MTMLPTWYDPTNTKKSQKDSQDDCWQTRTFAERTHREHNKHMKRIGCLTT